MNRRFPLRALVFCVSLSLSAWQANAQARRTDLSGAQQQQQSAAAARLRELFFKHDYLGGLEEGRKLAARFPADMELRAWHLASMARLPEMNAEAVELAGKLVAEKGESLWTLTALVHAQSFSPKRDGIMTAADKLIKLAPAGDEEAVFTYHTALLAARKYAESVAWLDKNSPAVRDRARFQAARANSLYQIAAGSKDQAKIDEALAAFAGAVELDPDSVRNNYLYAFYLYFQKRPGDALPYVKKAAARSPASVHVRLLLWKTLLEQPGKTEEQKKAELAAELESFLKTGGESPGALAAVAEQYGLHLKNKEKRDFYEDRILARHPNTRHAEAILYARIPRVYDKYLKGFDAAKMIEIAFKSESERTAEEKKELSLYNQKTQQFESEMRLLRRAFVKRPVHFDLAKLGNVYFDLLKRAAASKDTPDGELAKLIAGSLKYKKDNSLVVNSEIALLLTDRAGLRPGSRLGGDAERYARAGLAEAENKADLLAPNNPFATPETLRGRALNVLGQILTKAGKLDEAEEALLRAEKLDRGGGQENMSLAAINHLTTYNLAELYAAKKDFAKAEEYYLKNASDNDSARKTFSRLYVRRHGTTEGFDEYYAGVRQKLRARERERVLASRIKDPADAVPFSLKTIDDKTVSLADLKGKVVVINVWGVWCAPCVAEMPQFQQFYKKYENDEEVAVITMDTNDELEKVKKFMADKKYDFPVLIGDTYVGNVMKGGMFVFPTTVFIDKRGKVSFIKRGNTGNILEEFAWRVEALKQDK